MCETNWLVTVIISTHKRSPEIVERALLSATTQTYKNMEIIVVDDSPADFPQRSVVREMVESYQKKGVKYIAHEMCKGACAARNTGLAEAKGEFVAFLDDDDEWLPNKISCQINKFDNEEVALVYNGIYFVNDKTGEKKLDDTTYLSGYVFDKMLEKNYIGPTSIPLIRKKCLLEVGGFDEQMQSAQDYDLWLRLTQKYAIDYCQEPLVVYHIYDGERITTNHKKKIAGLERIIEKYSIYLKRNRKALGAIQLMLTPYYASDGQLCKALCYWCAGVCKSPALVVKNLRFLKWLLTNYFKNKG